MCVLCVWSTRQPCKPANSPREVQGTSEPAANQVVEVMSMCTLQTYNAIWFLLKQCRGKRVRVFLSGDYEFLCHMFGLSGASGIPKCCTSIAINYFVYCIGKHCCLWCLTKNDSLKSPPNPLCLRTTGSICVDYNSFVADGADLKRAKFHNNVIREPFFKHVPIEQVNIH